MSRDLTTSAPGAHELRCMEIWGGNAAIDDGISAPGIDAWFFSQPYRSESRGGDIHYASMCGAGHIARFVVADVAGHGEVVDALAQRLRSLMRKHINTPDQTRFTRALNEEMLSGDTQGRFATALLATYFVPRNQMIVCNAGHPRPMWYRAATGQWGLLHHDHEGAIHNSADLPLGVIEPTSYHQFAVTFEPGDLIVIVTDGLAEAADEAGVMLGEQRLLEMVGQTPLDDLSQFIPRFLARHESFRDGAPLDDDLTIVLLHHNAAPPRRIGLGERAGAFAKMMGLAKV